MKRTTKLLWLLALGFSASTIAQEHEGRNYTRVIKVRSLGSGFLGVQLTPLTPELRVHFGVAEDTGVMVARVEEGGPAHAAGIRVGDILSAIDGERIDSGRQLSRAVRKKEEGDLVMLELYRDGSLESYPVRSPRFLDQSFDARCPQPPRLSSTVAFARSSPWIPDFGTSGILGRLASSVSRPNRVHLRYGSRLRFERLRSTDYSILRSLSTCCTSNSHGELLSSC